ncbi:MAG: hypothetical protein M1839_006936 [Geoglossum umbratile]|nr:MAG: hypothetical protein M1839_006936 [Geoglossum umbratile]
MSPSDRFLADAVEKAIRVAETGVWSVYKANCWALPLEDPFARYLTSEQNPQQRAQLPETPHSAHSTPTPFSWRIRVDNQSADESSSGDGDSDSQNPSRAPSSGSIGVVLAEIFLVLSVLSKSSDFVRLPAISDLHEYPIVGSGASFIARKVPCRRVLGSEGSRHLDHNFFAYKSIRHYNYGATTGDSGGSVSRLGDLLLEIQVLTHPPISTHENIVKLIGFGWELNRTNEKSHVFYWPFVVLEYALWGSMVDLFEEENVKTPARKSLCIDVGRGLAALHACDIVHGDVKMENILISPHSTRGYVAKLADFGYTMVDLDEKAPKAKLRGRTIPWEAPEFDQWMVWKDLRLTDVYSFGFLIWRCICYGQYPFTENGGLITEEIKREIIDWKSSDLLLGAAAMSLSGVDPGILSALEFCLQHNPRERDLNACMRALGGGPPSAVTLKPLRRMVIPPEQGLGIYEYGEANNLRFKCQFRHSIESYALSSLAHDWNVSATIVGDGSYTIHGDYLEKYTAGDDWDPYHETYTNDLAAGWLTVSAGSQRISAVEALFPLHVAFPSADEIPSTEPTLALAAMGLVMGTEFLVKDVREQPVPRKNEYLELLRTKLCQGSGLILNIPKDAFDGSGEVHFSELLGKTVRYSDGRQGLGTPEYFLGVAASWGCMEATKRLVCDFGAAVDAQDRYGETALFKASRAGHSHIVKWLLTHGKAKADLATKKGVNPLHWLNSFSPNEVGEIATMLKRAGADPNAVAVPNEDHVESAFYHFKGPPLIRVVASGNCPAVAALLGIGADPRIKAREGSAIALAARRLRLDVLKLLLQRIGDSQVWDRNVSGGSLIRRVITCSANYGAKIHGERYHQAQLDIFDYLWDMAEHPSRLFRSVQGNGEIAIQVAVGAGNLAFVKRIVESCSVEGHLKQLLVTIGLQHAIIHGRRTMFHYFLRQGALPLHPVLPLQPEKDQQYQDYVLYGPWTMDLAYSQRKTTCLHICARAGDLAETFGQAILEHILPPSRWDETPETLRKQNKVNCNCDKKIDEDPLVDCRNEYDETPYFLALRAEEYKLAWRLYQAGANQNALIRHRLLSRLGPLASNISLGRDPILFHAIRWISAFRALRFIFHECWGCAVTTHPSRTELPMNHPSGLRFAPSRELRDAAIEETANWPFEEASIVFHYILEMGYPNHKWNRAVIDAIDCLNEAAVSEILHKPQALPDHPTPERLYDAVRERLIKAFSQGPSNSANQAELTTWRKEHMDICRKAWAIIGLIRDHYPSHPLGGIPMPDFVAKIWSATHPELSIARYRYEGGATGAEKFCNEVEYILQPWLAVMAAARAPDQLQQLWHQLNYSICEGIGIDIFLDEAGEGLRKEEGRILYRERFARQDLDARIQERTVERALGGTALGDLLLARMLANMAVGPEGNSDSNREADRATVGRVFELEEEDED